MCYNYVIAVGSIMVKILEKEEVIHLRHKGESVRDIAHKIGVSKSTVSMWCRDISLSSEQIRCLQERQKRASARVLFEIAERNRARRVKKEKVLKREGWRRVGSMSIRDLFVAGLALYWGEGYKREYRGGVEFSNSDPAMILFFIDWLRELYNVSVEQLTLRVGINHIHRNREKVVLQYWSKVTSVPLSQFTKTSFIRSDLKKIYKNHNEHFGTLRVKVQKSTDLKRRILGSIGALGSR